MTHYRHTDDKVLTLDNLKALRDKYDSAGTFPDLTALGDFSFMDDLFLGLGSVILAIELLTRDCERLRRELDDERGEIR